MLLKENIPVKYVVGKIKNELLLVAVYAVAIALFHRFLPEYRISIPIAVPAILATIISLLLAFRSNQAARFPSSNCPLVNCTTCTWG